MFYTRLRGLIPRLFWAAGLNHGWTCVATWDWPPTWYVFGWAVAGLHCASGKCQHILCHDLQEHDIRTKITSCSFYASKCICPFLLMVDSQVFCRNVTLDVSTIGCIPCLVNYWHMQEVTLIAKAWKTEAAEESMGEKIVRSSSVPIAGG